jgi:multidrug efflux pump subunit AcrA (membrane-fusion protein)
LLVSQINESIYFPTAPFSGVVQRVLVKEGQSVSPGTPLMIIAQDLSDDPISAIAFVSRDIAQRVSLIETSTLHMDDYNFDVLPSFVSTEAVQGTLYAIYYPLPDYVSKHVTDAGFITVDVPIGYPDTTTTAPFIPLDAVYQTQDKAYIFVINNNKAEISEIKLGQVYGSFVEVVSGIRGGDRVILDRTIVQGDDVKL